MPTSRRGNDAANDLGASGRAGSDDLSELSTGPRTGSDDLSDLSTVPQALSDAVTEDASANEPALQLGPLTALSLRALNRLAQYKAPRDRWPQVRRAAVLVALFAGRHGDLYVILSKRAKTLRNYPGDVALPGGKRDESDLNLEMTARREALEEIGLPTDNQRVRYLCSLRPFLARTNLIVTPVVCFIMDPHIVPDLNPAEVDEIFAHPLESFLFNTPRPPVSHSLDPEVQKGRRPYHMQYDIPWLHNKPYRMHRFESKKAPIIGFTADVLIEAARVAYREPEFDRKARDQLPRRRLIEIAVNEIDDFAKAAQPRSKL